ncbi:MAG: Gfo/Idh/MocA family oxidoreductase [Candidatus Bathyarchaeota archaeon]|jgi:UDP-N-acetylglucosamine 3-dehydrogenase|nr:Gfo/Idh/MocA family oxidoreductase [Candidatus Bathyarchaeota archaeon]
MDKVKLGLIGLGYIGKVHLLNCLKLREAQLVAVADVSPKALNMAKKMGVAKIYQDYHELLQDSEIDAVIIALPTYLHAECAKIAAENHKHVLLEKPLARNVNEGEEIVRAAKKHGIKLMVGHTARYNKVYKDLKKEIDEGILGEIQVAYAVNVSTGPFTHRSEEGTPKPVPEWWWKKELTGGGALLDLGSHMINLTRWFFGEVVDVESYMGYRYNLEQEDYAICILKFKSGPVAIINVGWFSLRGIVKLEVYGTTGSATASYSSPSRVIKAIQLILKKIPGFYIPYLNEVQHFVECIEKDVQPQPSGEDALEDLKIIEKAYKNAKTLSSYTTLKWRLRDGLL